MFSQFKHAPPGAGCHIAQAQPPEGRLDVPDFRTLQKRGMEQGCGGEFNSDLGSYASDCTETHTSE